MKKDSVFLWIVAVIIIATGVSLGATSSQASDLNEHLRDCNFNRLSGDKVTSVRINTVSGDVVMFDVNLAVDKAHLHGYGVVLMAVIPFDRYGNNLARSWTTARSALYGSPLISTVSTLKRAHSLSEVVHLLVGVEAVSPKGAFKFCDIFHNINGAWVPYQPPNVLQQPDPGFWEDPSTFGKSGGFE